MISNKGKGKTAMWIVLGVTIVLIFILIMSYVGAYNSLVNLDEGTTQAWADVQGQYQRRADLIPNLVETVKGFANQEQEVLLGVTQARTNWLNSQGGSIDSQIEASNQMDSALSRLLVTVEAYPDIKSNQNFLALQDEIAGTENRVAVARTRYNEAVKTYNVKVRSFPSNIVAGISGFEKATPFEAQAGSKVAPEVKF